MSSFVRLWKYCVVSYWKQRAQSLEKTFHLLEAYLKLKTPKIFLLLFCWMIWSTAYSTRFSELFTKVSLHSNINLVLITQNLLHRHPSSSDISINNKDIVQIKNPRNKIQIVHMTRQFCTNNTPIFHKTYLDVSRNPQSYFFFDLTQSIKDLFRFRRKVLRTK